MIRKERFLNVPPTDTPTSSGLPRLPSGAIRRERLLTMLDGPASLCLVRAGGGSGKTTLLTQWAGDPERTRGLEPIWITRDAAAASRSGYWLRVLSRLHLAGLLSDAAFYREIAAVADRPDAIGGALDRVFGEHPKPVVLLLDNFGSSDADGFWDEVSFDLVHLLRGRAGVRAIVAGRFPTLLETPHAHTHLDVETITDEDLAFTDAEALTIMDQQGSRLDDSARRALLERDTAKHPYWLRYTVDMLEHSAELPARISAERLDASLGRAARQDLLSRIRDPELLEFLGIIAQAPYVDLALATELVGTPAALPLERLEHAGVGRWEYQPGGRSVFRLGAPIHAAAADHYAARHPHGSAPVHSSISHWLFTNRGDAVLAAEHALRAGDYDYLTHIVLRSHPLPTAESIRMSAVLARAPESQLRQHPLLALRHAIVLNGKAETQPKALALLEAAYATGRRRSGETPLLERAITLALESSVARLLGDEGRMRESASRALALFRSALTGPQPDHTLDGAIRSALDQCGMSLFYADEPQLAHEAWIEYAQFGTSRGTALSVNIAYAGISLLEVSLGRPDAARQALGRIEEVHWPDQLRDSYTRSPELLARTWIAIDAGRSEEALEILRRIDSHFTSSEHWEFMISARVVAEAMLGRTAEAQFRLAQARPRINRRTLPSVRRRFESTRILLDLLAGAPTSPATAPKRAADPFETALRAISAAVLGSLETALSLLGTAEQHSTTPRDRMGVAVAAALLGIRAGAELDVVAYGAQISAIIEDRGLQWPVILFTEHDRRELLRALEQAEQHGTAAALGGAFARIPALMPEPLWNNEPAPKLTPREREVLAALVATNSRAEIAERLFVSINTVKAQLRSLYGKLGARNREETLAAALRHGLIPSARVEG